MKQVDLFGNEVDEFITAKERFGVWPTTVWDCDFQDPGVRQMKQMIGDDGSARKGTKSVIAYQTADSIFNPAVAAWCLNMYAPTEGVCYDPFAGGGTRAIMAVKHGLRYVGCELREEECRAVEARCEAAGAENFEIHKGDSRYASTYFGKWIADFCYTCPPYWNMEQYDGGAGDVSMCRTYEEFQRELYTVIQQQWEVVKPGSYVCWIIGMHRTKEGELLPLHHAVAELHRRAGFRFREEVVLAWRNNGSLQRVGMFDKGQGHLIRSHEYLLVFTR